jgi:hypothetical protein
MGGLVLAAVIAGGAYLISLRVHPYRKCRSCGTSGRHESRGRTRYGNCWRCQDRTLVRLGVRVLMRRRYAEIQAGKHGRFH